MKKLTIGIRKGIPAKAPQIRRADVAAIVRKLTPMEKKILQKVFIEHVGMGRMRSMHPVNSLCAKGIIRKDWDLISKSEIYVVERGGRMVLDALANKGKLAKKKPARAVVAVDRHVFEKFSIAGVVQALCKACKKLPEHPVHIAEGRYLCPGLMPLSEAGADAVRCLTEVKRQGELCMECKAKAERWRKAEAVRMSNSCPSCGEIKAIAPSTACSFDKKCYHRLPKELQVQLFKQQGETESAFRVRYPIALNECLKHLAKHPPSQAEINAQAKVIPA